MKTTNNLGVNSRNYKNNFLAIRTYINNKNFNKSKTFEYSQAESKIIQEYYTKKNDVENIVKDRIERYGDSYSLVKIDDKLLHSLLNKEEINEICRNYIQIIENKKEIIIEEDMNSEYKEFHDELIRRINYKYHNIRIYILLREIFMSDENIEKFKKEHTYFLDHYDKLIGDVGHSIVNILKERTTNTSIDEINMINDKIIDMLLPINEVNEVRAKKTPNKTREELNEILEEFYTKKD